VSPERSFPLSLAYSLLHYYCLFLCALNGKPTEIILKNIVGFDLALPFALVLLQHFFTHFFLFCIFSATSILNMTWQLCMHDTQNRADTGKTEKNI